MLGAPSRGIIPLPPPGCAWQHEDTGRRLEPQFMVCDYWIERLVNGLKQCRRVATRYEKRVVDFLAMVPLAASLRWL